MEDYAQALPPETGPNVFKKAWARLLPGYAIEALWAPAWRDRKESPAERLAALLRAPVQAFPAVGVGEEYRFQARDFLGAALVAEDGLAHLMAFPV